MKLYIAITALIVALQPVNACLSVTVVSASGHNAAIVKQDGEVVCKSGCAITDQIELSCDDDRTWGQVTYKDDFWYLDYRSPTHNISDLAAEIPLTLTCYEDETGACKRNEGLFLGLTDECILCVETPSGFADDMHIIGIYSKKQLLQGGAFDVRKRSDPFDYVDTDYSDIDDGGQDVRADGQDGADGASGVFGQYGANGADGQDAGSTGTGSNDDDAPSPGDSNTGDSNGNTGAITAMTPSFPEPTSGISNANSSNNNAPITGNATTTGNTSNATNATSGVFNTNSGSILYVNWWIAPFIVGALALMF